MPRRLRKTESENWRSVRPRAIPVRMAPGSALAIDRQRVQRSAPSRPKTASGGLRPLPHRRLSRWRLQGANASGKNAASYDPWRRVPHLPQSDTPECSGVQRAFRATGEFLGNAGSDVALGGVGLGVIGVGVAGVSASTVVLAPGGVLAGGALATAGGTIAAAGGVAATVGAGLQILGGSGKAAIGDVAGRFLTHRLPNGALKDALQSGIDSAVNAIPFEFQVCK